MKAAARELTVPERHAGSRLDAWLAEALEIPRAYVRTLIALGVLQPPPAAAGRRVRAGERIAVAPFRHPREGPLPSAQMPLCVLAQRGSWLAVDKPAGTPAHPLHYEEQHTMVNAFLARYPGAAGVGDGGLYAGLVHRLDPGTSGVLLFASEPQGWSEARAAFTERRAHKHYVARVHGVLTLPRPRSVTLQLSSRGPRMRVVASGGREAITHLQSSSASGGETSLIDLRIETGVRHQIRATLAHLGHPVVGDTLYGAPPAARLALHAARLQIGDFCAESPTPEL